MINIRFTSDTLPNDTFQVLQLEGEEQLSRLFRFELRLVSRDPNIDFKTALEGQASLAITTQGETRYIHGMLSEFEQGAAWHSGLYEYRAVLVPRLWMMTQSVQNQIYQNLTVPDILQGELDNIQSKGEHPLVMNGLTHADYEIHTVGDYDEREYVVQYRESDFNFISRLMEHEGIYYYFDHDDSAEKLVITDIMAPQESADQAPVQFQADAAHTNYAKDIVYKLSRAQKQVPGSVLMKDFNYRSPSLPLQATDIVVPDGIGFVTEYGAHFKTPEEGHKLATIRAEEFRCQQNSYSGESHVGRFCCGHVYSLTNHFREDYNQDYLMTKVIHHASQAIESWGKVGGTSYHNEFSCIPADLQYRPQRLTPKPRLYGIMNGVIDSEQDMDRADIDEEGRYKVLMPFDISGAAPGKASRRIRMAQPYGGHGAGMSFPLVKGTEVIWTCIDGDIDRPIITGAVPNPLNPSVTTTHNHSSNVIKTMSGITMGFHDGNGSAGQSTTGGGAGGGITAQQQYQSADTDSKASVGSRDKFIESPRIVAASISQDYPVNRQLEQQQQMVNNRVDLFRRVSTNNATQWSIGIPYNPSTSTDEQGKMRREKDVYLRLGAASSWEQEDWGGAWGKDGLLSYVDGDRNLVTMGDDSHWHYGGSNDYYSDPQVSFFNDDVSEFYLGKSFDFKAGLMGEISAGVKTSLNLNLLEAEVNVGAKVSMGAAMEYTIVNGPSLELAGEIVKESNDRVNFRSDPEDDGSEWFVEKFVPGAAAVLGLTVAATATVATALEAGKESAGGTQGEFTNNFATGVEIATHTLGALCGVIAIADSIKRYRKKKNSLGDGAANFDMNPEKMTLSVVGVKDPCKPNETQYDPANNKIIMLLANNESTKNDLAKAVSMFLKKSGDSQSDSIELSCGTSKLIMNDYGITLQAGENSVVVNKTNTTLKKHVQCQSDLKAVENFVVGGTANITGQATFEEGVKIKGKLDSATVKNSALVATVTAMAASTAKRDKLEKEINKLIEDNKKRIEANTKDIEDLIFK